MHVCGHISSSVRLSVLCTCFDADQIGLVSDVVSYSGNDLLKVVDTEQKEHLIPIRKELIKFFDIEDRKLLMKTIEGILDI